MSPSTAFAAESEEVRATICPSGSSTAEKHLVSAFAVGSADLLLLSRRRRRKGIRAGNDYARIHYLSDLSFYRRLLFDRLGDAFSPVILPRSVIGPTSIPRLSSITGFFRGRAEGGHRSGRLT